MFLRYRFTLILALGLALVSWTAQGADLTASLKSGTPDLKSAGSLSFGPDGVLFVGDAQGAAVFALDTGDRGPNAAKPIELEGIDEKIAAALGTTADQIQINDLAVNPASGKAYLSVSRGRGTDAQPVLVRVDSSGEFEVLSLENVKFAKATLPNAPEAGATDRRGRSRRTMSITDLAYVDGRVFVAGLSNEEFSSRLRSIPFPFSTVDKGTGIEIYHGAHGRFETNSPVRTFTLYDIAGDPHLLAAYTCTPLVKLPVSALKAGGEIRGITVAELGNRNNPLDMIVYEKGGTDYILLTNSSRGVMKITTDKIGSQEPITSRIGGTAGQTYETIEELKGVQEMAQLDEGHALIIVRAESGALNLHTISLP